MGLLRRYHRGVPSEAWTKNFPAKFRFVERAEAEAIGIILGVVPKKRSRRSVGGNEKLGYLQMSVTGNFPYFADAAWVFSLGRRKGKYVESLKKVWLRDLGTTVGLGGRGYPQGGSRFGNHLIYT